MDWWVPNRKVICIEEPEQYILVDNQFPKVKVNKIYTIKECKWNMLHGKHEFMLEEIYVQLNEFGRVYPSYLEDGFMPFALWIQNCQAVNKLLSEFNIIT